MLSWARHCLSSFARRVCTHGSPLCLWLRCAIGSTYDNGYEVSITFIWHYVVDWDINGKNTSHFQFLHDSWLFSNWKMKIFTFETLKSMGKPAWLIKAKLINHLYSVFPCDFRTDKWDYIMCLTWNFFSSGLLFQTSSMNGFCKNWKWLVFLPLKSQST